MPNMILARFLFNSRKRVRLFRKIGRMVSKGYRVQDALEDLLARESRSATNVMSGVLGDALHGVRSGVPLSASLAPFIPSNEVIILRAGEVSGNLAEATDLAARIIRVGEQMRKAVIRALALPILLLTLVILSLVIVGNHVVPKLAMTLDPGLWTGWAGSLYTLSEITVSPWFYAGIGLVTAAGTAMLASMPYWSGGRLRTRLDRWPPYAFYRIMVGGGWLLSLSAMISAGVNLTSAIREMRDTSQPWMFERLDRILFYLRSGLNMGMAMDAAGYEFPDREIVEDLVTYARLPDLDAVLRQMGEEWIEDGLARIEAQAVILNTASTLLIGAVIGWFAYSAIDLQIQLSSSLSGMG